MAPVSDWTVFLDIYLICTRRGLVGEYNTTARATPFQVGPTTQIICSAVSLPSLIVFCVKLFCIVLVFLPLNQKCQISRNHDAHSFLHSPPFRFHSGINWQHLFVSLPRRFYLIISSESSEYLKYPDEVIIESVSPTNSDMLCHSLRLPVTT